MSEYQIKKNLRRGAGGKSYAELEQQIDFQQANLNKKQYEVPKQSILDHKGWSVKERVKLLVFLCYYRKLPDWSSQRKSIHLYKHLSNFLKKTRTPEQCKNIHSLLKRKHQTMIDIIEFIQDKLEAEENYERLLQKYQNQIKKFQTAHNLFADCTHMQDHDLTFPRPKSLTQRDESSPKGQQQRIFKTARQNSGIAEIRFKPLKQEDGLIYSVKDGNHGYGQDIPDEFAKRRRELIQNCNFYFMEWLKCAKMIEHLSERAQKDK